MNNNTTKRKQSISDCRVHFSLLVVFAVVERTNDRLWLEDSDRIVEQTPRFV